MVLLIGTVSAFDVQRFDDKIGDYGKIIIEERNWYDPLGWATEKIKIEKEITEHTSKCLINCYTEGTSILYEDMPLFDKFEFENRKGEEVSLDYNIFIKQNVSYEYTLGIYDEENQLKSIEKEIRIQEEWVEYNYEVLNIGTYQWRLEGKKDLNEDVDWIGTTSGKKLTNWAWWDSFDGVFEIFDTPGTQYWTVPSGITNISLLVVAGGGSGGGDGENDGVGGGGGGGIYFNNNFSVTPGTNFTVVVGDGGTWVSGDGVDGENSTFGNVTTIVAIGGGAGDLSAAGSAGGSGGGGGSNGGNGAGGSGLQPGSASGGYGNIGGAGNNTEGVGHRSGGGGGGAGSAGVRGDIDAGGAGGNPITIYGEDWSEGGEGADNTHGAGANGAANTGNGGAGGQGVGGEDGGNGGSGIIVVRYSEVGITLNSPINNYRSIDRTVIFNGTVIGYVDSISNVSLILNGKYNETNSSGINATDYLFTKILNKANHNWTYEVCNDVDFCDNATIRNFTIADYVEYFYTFNNQTYETESETFYVNITTYNIIPTAGKLIYGGVTHSDAIITNIGGDYYNISRGIVIPASVGNKTFYFNFTLDGVEYNTTNKNQTVNLISFGLCNDTLIEPYINFSFKDEADNSYINATIDSSTWAYWLGDGTVYKSLLFSNNSVNFNYTFCFLGGNRTLHNNRSLQFASPGYPQRKYDASDDLTNTTTDKILWLLSSSDGIYSTIQVVDANGDRVSGVEVTAERQFTGTWTVIGQEETDDAGSVTFWLNPDYDHRFTFVSDDCVGTFVTIRPTQTQYTQQLSCDGTGEDFVTTLEGIRYTREPVEGIIQTGIKNFTYFITSSKYLIVNATLQVINASDSAVLNSSTTTCNADECIVYFIYDVQSGDNLKGRYYFDVGNGSILLEADAHWINVGIDTEGKSGMGTFWKDMRYVIDEWGDDPATADFNRILIVFFFMCLAIAFFNYHTGVDTQNPGAFMVILTFVILSGSLVGWIDGTGFFFYTNNLTGIHFLNNYILAMFCIVITFSYLIRTNIQANR